MQDRLVAVLILMSWVVGCHDPTRPPTSSPSSQAAVHRPGSLQEAANFLGDRIQGTWEIEKANRLSGHKTDWRGNWRWSCILINNPRNSETGRQIAEEMGTAWSSCQTVVADSDAFVLISNYPDPEVMRIASLLELTMLASPQDIRTYVVEHCGLVWKDLRLERPER